MKMKLMASALILAAAGVAAPAMADDWTGLTDDTGLGVAGDFQVRLRAVGVIPDPSARIAVGGSAIGGATKISDSAIPEADLTYFLTDHIAVEAIAGVTKHSVSNSVAGPLGSVSLLPPTITAQYHFDPTGWIRPYLGAGVNYTFFYDVHSPLPDMHYRNTFGWALQGGADIPIGDGPYFINVDAKKLFLNTSIRAVSGAVRAHADLDPWLIGGGIGIRF